MRQFSRVMKVKNEDGDEVVEEIDVVSYSTDADREFYITYLDHEIESGAYYKISMTFVAKLNDNLKGFYRSVYKNEQGQKEYIAVTQFQVGFMRTISSGDSVIGFPSSAYPKASLNVREE